jgi:hypothetical protein
MKPRCPFSLLLALATLSLPTARAGEAMNDGKKTVVEPTTTAVPLTLFRLRSSYVFESDFDNSNDTAGDAWSNTFEFGQRFPLDLGWPQNPDGRWFLRLGADYTRFDFDHSGTAPLPATLQSIAGVIALEYIQAGEVGILLETAPGVYFENDVNSGTFDSPTKLAAAFPLTTNFYLVAGGTYSGLRSYPFLPVIGAFWRINDRWTLRAIVPEPRLIYRATDRLALWVGGEIAGGSFRTDDDQDRDPALRKAVLTYSEYRVGAGFTYGDGDRCAVDVGAGYAFERKFDYHRADEDFQTEEGAPFVKVTLRAAF